MAIRSWASFNGEEWRPATFGLGMLLAQCAREREMCVTLTFIESKSDDDSSECWCFSIQPGSLYELSAAHFFAGDAEKFSRHLATIEPNAFGLLVTVGVRVSDGVPQLTLRDTPWKDAQHVELSCPFDDRNLRWQRQFGTNDVLEVERDQESDRWLLNVASLPGFPESLKVIWDSGYPRKAEQRVEVIVGQWTEKQMRMGEISVRRVETVGLNDKGYTLAELYEFVQTIAEGDEITLTRTLAAEPRGDDPIVCITKHGLRLPVALDSVTFLLNCVGVPLAARVFERNARINYCRWGAFERVEVQDIAELPAGSHEGIIARVPRVDAIGAACQVLFKIDQEITPLLVHVSSPRQRDRLQAGTRLIVEKRGAQLTANIQRLRLHAIALWRVEMRSDLELDSVFLGEFRWEGSNVWISESATTPGLLLISPPTGDAPLHLAQRHKGSWQHGLQKERIYRDEQTRDIFEFERGQRLYRCLLLSIDRKSRHLLPGWTVNSLRGGEARIRNVSIRLLRSRNPKFVEVRRKFTLAAAKVVGSAEPDDASLTPDRDAILDLLRGSPQPCAVQAIATAPKAVLLHRGLSRRDATLPIVEEGLTRISGVSYASDGRAEIFKTEGGWMADFCRVPPMDVEGFREHLRVALGQRVDLDAFYFIGPAEGVAAGPTPTAWLFEFGYGFTLRVETSRLRHKGGEFDLRGTLFLGDRVKAFALSEIDNDGVPLLCVDILDVAFQSAPATVLFHQAKRKIVNLLRVRHEEDKTRILSIEGCDERHLASFATFTVERARVRPRSWGVSRAEMEADVSRAMYGRLDTAAFARSHGHCVEFEPIRLTFDQKGLLDGDIIFLKAFRIEETPSRNDVFLRFSPVADLDSEDVGRDFVHGVRVTRRQFSAREALLRRQFEIDPGGIRDVFPIRVRAPVNNEGIKGSLMQGIPDRRTAALRDHLRQSREPAFGTILRREDDQTFSGESGKLFRIEFRPGIFFSLGVDEVTDKSAHLREGTLVRLEFQDVVESFLLLPCSFSDEVYFGSHPRPVVALPLTPLLRSHVTVEPEVRNDHWWRQPSRERMFSIGDFPDTVCPLARDNHGRILPPHARDAIRFMGLMHPKIAWRTRGENGAIFLLPDDGEALVGKLTFNSNLAVEYASFDSPPKVEAVSWMDLTYADQPIRVLMARCKQRSWSYHDRQSGYWSDRGVVWDPVERNSVLSGPLFFERDGDSKIRLRHRPDRLHDFGVPLREPVEVLGKGIVSLTIAAWAKVDGELTGLWLEWVPGRILHMPAELLCWQSQSGRFSLGSLDWLHFAPGDEIKLRAVEGQILAPDSLEMLAWHRNPRACFGRGPALLPVVADARMDDALVVGAGRFKLTLPSIWKPEADAFWLWNDNSTGVFDGNFKPDDIVMLGIDEVIDAVVVLGCEGITAAPDQRGDRFQWRDHPLRPIAFHADDAGIDWGSLKDLIRAVGGALPATVEGFDSTHHRVYFSFREQFSKLRPSSITIATAIGFLARGPVFDEDRLVLWLGRGFVCWPCHEIIPGVPSSLRATVAEALILARTEIWMKADPSGRIRLGYAEEPASRDVLVSPKEVVGGLGSSDGWGLVARSEHSGRLYWVPGVFTAWAELTPADAKEYFLRTPRPFQAKLILGQAGEYYLSLLSTVEANAEAAVLLPGSQTRVFLRREVSSVAVGTRVFLAETLIAGLLVRCELPDRRQYVLDDLEAVEVERRNGGHRSRSLRVVVVDKDYRLHRLALPASWLDAMHRQPGFREMLEWMNEAVVEPWTREELATRSAEPWERRLCHVVALIEREPTAEIGMRELRHGCRLLESDGESHILPSLLVLCGLLDLTINASAQSRRDLIGQLATAADALYRRAVRSLHLEIGFRHGLARSSSATQPLATPLGRIQKLLSSTLNPKNMSAIRRWATFAEISLDPSLQAVAYSLHCASGKLPAPTASQENRSILGEIIATSRCLNPVNPGIANRSFATQALQALREQVRDLIEAVQLQRCDLPLLSPIPARISVDPGDSVPRED